MHILLVHNDYGRFSGEEAAVNGIADLLESGGHRVSWFRESSVDLENSTTDKIGAFFTGIYNPAARRRISRLLDRDRIDLVQVQNLYPLISPSVLIACRDRKIPVVMRCPNYRLFCPAGLHLRDNKICEACLGKGHEWNCIRYSCAGNPTKSIGYAIRGMFARRTRMITDNVTVFAVLSEFQKRRFINNGIPSERIAILPNIAASPNLDCIPPAPQCTISFVGRLSEEKGIREFIEAARRLPDIPFAAAGDIAPKIEQLIENKSENLSIRGFLSGDEFDRFYADSRIIVCPSKWFEGFPNVIAKAMAHSKPVIGTRIGAIPEIIDDGKTGLLCNPGDTDDLARCISDLWQDEARCALMGEAGREKAANSYSEIQVYEALMAAYEMAVGTKAA